MRRTLLASVLFLLAGMGQSFAQYPVVTIRQIQQVPQDSLRLADSLQGISSSRWYLQASTRQNDTVTVVALVVVPAKVLTFTQCGYTMLLYDTLANPYPWGGILVRASSDTATHTADGFLNVARGDWIRMTGVVSEFPGGSYNSLTQFQPIPSIPIQILSRNHPIPPAPTLPIGDFYQGIFAGGKVKFSTGEQYESMLVKFTDATVDAQVFTSRGTFSMVDLVGNQISDYDASRFFTLGGSHGSSCPLPADSMWNLMYPLPGTRVVSLTGFINTVSGQENPRGYRVAPVNRGDVVFGVVLPSITTHRRNPIVVPPDSAARVSVRVTQQPNGFPIDSVQLHYSLNNGPFTRVNMTFQASDTTYNGTIPVQPANTFVHYFVKARDNQGNFNILASSAFGGASSDTSKGFFLYNVLNRALTIRDLQFTPYVNGRSPYLGATVTVRGVVTADTSRLLASALTTFGTNAFYLQNGNQPWSGMWVYGILDSLHTLRNGDSISVTGSLSESGDVTQIPNVSTRPIVYTTGNAIPAPAVLPTSTFGPTVGNGTPSAEQYEGMLVRFNNVRVTDLYPYFADPTEFAIDDGTGPVLVRRDGTHRYSNVPADSAFGKTILKLGDRISSLTGVIYYSANRYKLVPRNNADFGTITDVQITNEGVIPEAFSLDQNYPNPFNPTTTIVYSLPISSPVTLKVYNVLGQEVESLVNAVQAPGTYRVTFDASSLSTGVYFYRIEAGNFARVRKLLLLK